MTLNTCPFCGSLPVMRSYHENRDFFIICESCGTITHDDYSSPDSAVSEWDYLCTKLFKELEKRPLKLPSFFERLKKYGVKMTFDHKLDVFLFYPENEDTDEKAINEFYSFLAKRPEYERALLWKKLGLGFPGIGDNTPHERYMRNYLYTKAAPAFSVSKEKDTPDLKRIRDYWLKVIYWLSNNGGDIPDLHGAVRYVLEANYKQYRPYQMGPLFSYSFPKF